MCTDIPMLYNIEQVARILAISRSSLYNLMSRGAISHVQIGRSKRFTKEQVEKLIAALPTSESLI
jgi:excisionase family DNA binding protein